MALTYPSVVIQTNLTFTAKRWGQFPTISFTNGATAGSEVVTVDSNLNITVQIQSGTSTMLQIKTAIDATAGSANGLSAGDLVSVVVTAGHNTDAVLTCNLAALSGGTALAKATKTIGHLIYTAVTSGSAGNNIRVKYTSGSSLTVGVSTNDITVQLKNDGSSTNALIKAAVAASGPAAALVTCSSDGLTLAYIPLTDAAPAFVNLAGGTDAVAPSKIVQDLTFTSDKTGVTDNGKTVTYTTGATAGAEAVTVVGGNASIKIENGVSTATQIKAACDASAAMNGVAASGTVTISSFAAMHLTKASGTVTVVDYTKAVKLKAALVVQDLTYTAVAFGSGGNAITIAYVAGGTAGAEVVTVVGSAISVSMDATPVTGSSATQIKAAVDALPAAAALVAVTITGTGATVQAAAAATPLAGGQNATVVTVAGHALSSDGDWVAATTNDATATSLASAIDALTEVDASAVAAVITVLAHVAGSAGNAYATVTSASAAVSVGAATLAGGIDAATVNVNGTVLVESTDFNATVSNNQTATNLAAVIDALALVGAAALNAVVTITADAISSAGNAYVFTKTGSGLALNGSGTLTGGVDGYAVTVSGTGGTAQKTVNAAPMTGAAAATQPASPNNPPIRVSVI